MSSYLNMNNGQQEQPQQGQTKACSNCGVLLGVPPGAKAIQCSVCNAVTNLAQPDGLNILVDNEKINVKRYSTSATSIYTYQFRALFLKNLSFQKRQKWTNCCQLCCPAFVICVMGIIAAIIFSIFGQQFNPNAKPTVVLSPTVRSSEDSFTSCSPRFYLKTGQYIGGNILYTNGVNGVSQATIGYQNVSGGSGFIGHFGNRTCPKGYLSPTKSYFAPTTQYVQGDYSDAVFKILNSVNQYGKDNIPSAASEPYSSYCFTEAGSKKCIEWDEEVHKIPGAALSFSKLELAQATLDVLIQMIQFPAQSSFTAYNQQYLEMLDQFATQSIEAQGKGKVDVNLRGYVKMVVSKPFDPSTFINLLLTPLYPILIPFSVFFMFPVIVYQLVMERQNKLVEQMKLMGLNMMTYWSINWVYNFILYLFVMFLMIAIGALFSLPFFTKLGMGAVILFLVGWGCCMISFAFIISVVFSSPRSASLVSYMVVILSVVMGNAFSQLVYSKTAAPFWYMIIPPFALSRGVELFTRTMTRDNELPANLLNIAPDSELAGAYGYLYGCAVVYFFVAVYLEQVLPKRYGNQKKWYFPLMPIIRCCSSKKRPNPNEHISLLNSQEFEDLGDQACIDEKMRVINGETALVSINGLSKVYASAGGAPPKRALNEFYLNLSEGECLGLLGPNGAGKTTLCSLLTGMYQPTSGSCTVDGFNLTSEIDSIRQICGYCPQHDILFDDLTVKEHVLLFARLKGVHSDDEMRLADHALAQVGLSDSSSKFALDLSGGMRRRLSISIAAWSGDPRFLILDEPTTGLDPTARRDVWEIIRRAQEHRSIILTTHSMEEADALSSRIVIMAKGAMRALGTQAQLKRRYGSGYTMEVVSDVSNLDRAKAFVEEVCPNAVLVTSFSGVMTYKVPSEDLVLSDVYRSLETNKSLYGIKEWAISQSSLEEVFLTLVSATENMEESAEI